MLNFSDLELNDDLTDEDYNCYNPLKPISILGYDEIDAEAITISISKKLHNDQVMELLNNYLDFLMNCEEQIESYFSGMLSVELNEDWLDDIEVYELSITINTNDDYGATMVLSNAAFGDCDIEIDFDKETIEDHR